MTHSRLSAEIDARPPVLWELVGHIKRWPEWDVTYQPVAPGELNPTDDDAIRLEHHVGSRTIIFDFQILSLVSGELLVAEGRGGEGEKVEERFELAPSESGGTTLTRETTYTLPGQTLGVAASTTFAEASVQRWAEQAFARLGHVLGDASAAHPLRTPGDIDTRSTDSGPITAQERYSSNLEEGNRLPQEPGARAPERPA